MFANRAPGTHMLKYFHAKFRDMDAMSAETWSFQDVMQVVWRRGVSTGLVQHPHASQGVKVTLVKNRCLAFRRERGKQT